MRLSQSAATQLVRQLLGKKVDKLSAAELRVLVECFIEGGKHALSATNGTARQAAEAVHYAQQLRANARHQSARKTYRAKKPGEFLSPEWQRIERILTAHREQLAPKSGVLGFGPGYRVRGGVPQPERTATIYVEKKLPDEALPENQILPTVLKSAQGEIAVDVVELGKLELQADIGSSLGASPNNWGTLGLYARDAHNRVVALTAAHVASVAGAYYAPDPRHQQAAYLGDRLRVHRDGLDAAAVLVNNPPAPPYDVPGIGYVRTARPLGDNEYIGTRFYGAASGYLDGKVVNPRAYWQSENAYMILTTVPTARGDSGGALFDSDGHPVGLLKGRFDGPNRYSLFTPLSLALQGLNCYA